MFEILTSHRSALAEGPLWHEDHCVVYWTDIISGTLYAFDPADGTSKKLHSGTPVGGMTIQDDGKLLLFRARGAIDLFDPVEYHIEPLLTEIPDERATRFNDVAADPAGRVFCGTMSTDERRGRLYRLDPDGSLRIVLEQVGCSNGIGWSPDRRTMYFTDSTEATIFAFDFDASTGEMTNRREFFTLKPGGTIGVPDGMTVDADGNVWAAIWGGSCLVQIDPSGAEIRRIAMPAEKVTCPTFGGPAFDQLYVTTAGGDDEGAPHGAGELIRVDVEARGAPEFRSRVHGKIELATIGSVQ
jgi:D-xylonolactonase